MTKLRYLEVGSYNGQWQLSMDIHDVSPNIEDSAYAGANIPTDKWVCIEWEFEDQPNRITLLGRQQTGRGFRQHAHQLLEQWNQVRRHVVPGKNSGLIGMFDSFGIGFHDWHPTKAFDLYYDDVVLDTKRIGCPAPVAASSVRRSAGKMPNRRAFFGGVGGFFVGVDEMLERGRAKRVGTRFLG